MNKTFKQFEDLFESYFLNERDTEYAFRNINKKALQKSSTGIRTC